jgi:hypothetical protein
MELNYLRSLPPQILMNYLLKVTEEYVTAHSTNNPKAIISKRNELFQIYQALKEKGLGEPPKNDDNLN